MFVTVDSTLTNIYIYKNQRYDSGILMYDSRDTQFIF